MNYKTTYSDTPNRKVTKYVAYLQTLAKSRKDVIDVLLLLECYLSADIMLRNDYFTGLSSFFTIRFYRQTFKIMKTKRQIKRAKRNIYRLSTHRLEMRCELFRQQADMRKLRSAVKAERYEEAAEIRDKMLKQKLVCG